MFPTLITGVRGANTRLVALLLCLPLLFSCADASNVDKLYDENCSPSTTKNVDCKVELESRSPNCSVNQCNKYVCDQSPVAKNISYVPTKPFDVLKTHIARADHDGHYQLDYDISFQPPQDATAPFVRGFELSFVKEDTGETTCFVMYTPVDVRHKLRKYTPRYFLKTKHMFDFGAAYLVSIQSLPKPPPGLFGNGSADDAQLQLQHYLEVFRLVMPPHPDERGAILCLSCWDVTPLNCCYDTRPPNNSVDCSTYTDPNAGRWVSGFKEVGHSSFARSIFAEFVAAPPHYCFEQYNLTLNQKTPILRTIRTTIVNQSDLKTAVYGSEDGVLTYQYGRHEFTGLQRGESYEIVVLPVNYRASDKRCVCPQKNNRCECKMSVWPNVKINKYLFPPPKSTEVPPCDELNGCAKSIDWKTKISEEEGADWTIAIIVQSFIIILFLVIIIGLTYYIIRRKWFNKYHLTTARFNRFIPSGLQPDSADKPGDSGIPLQPIGTDRLQILLLYAYDSEVHQHCVIALAEFLREFCNCDVELDVWRAEKIAQNKTDWAYGTVTRSDRVVVVHSRGAYNRYHAKLNGDSGTTVECVNADPFDDLFLIQLDIAAYDYHERVANADNANGKFLNVYFEYTSESEVLNGLLGGSFRYALPRNTDAFIEAVRPKSIMLLDNYIESEEWVRLTESISAASNWQVANPHWFVDTHVKRPPPMLRLATGVTVDDTADTGFGSSSASSAISQRDSVKSLKEGALEEALLQAVVDEQTGLLSTVPPTNCPAAEPQSTGPLELLSNAEAIKLNDDRLVECAVDVRTLVPNDKPPSFVNPTDSGIMVDMVVSADPVAVST